MPVTVKPATFLNPLLAGMCGAAEAICIGAFPEELEVDEDKLDDASLYELVSKPTGK